MKFAAIASSYWSNEMMRFFSALLLVLVLQFAVALAEEPSASGVVDALLHKFLANGEKVEGMRYAFVAKGLNVRSSGASVVPIMYLSIRESDSRRLDAYCRVRPVDDKLTEFWTMQLLEDGVYHLRNARSPNAETRRLSSKSDRDADKWAKRLIRFNRIWTCCPLGFPAVPMVTSSFRGT